MTDGAYVGERLKALAAHMGPADLAGSLGVELEVLDGFIDGSIEVDEPSLIGLDEMWSDMNGIGIQFDAQDPLDGLLGVGERGERGTGGRR